MKENLDTLTARFILCQFAAYRHRYDELVNINNASKNRNTVQDSSKPLDLTLPSKGTKRPLEDAELTKQLLQRTSKRYNKSHSPYYNIERWNPVRPSTPPKSNPHAETVWRPVALSRRIANKPLISQSKPANELRFRVPTDKIEKRTQSCVTGSKFQGNPVSWRVPSMKVANTAARKQNMNTESQISSPHKPSYRKRNGLRSAFRRFPLKKQLTTIFLQGTSRNNDAGNASSSDDSNSTPSESTPDTESCSSSSNSRPHSSSGGAERTSSSRRSYHSHLCNPFKKVPDGTSENYPRLILAPSKLGAQQNTAGRPIGSSNILRPSALSGGSFGGVAATSSGNSKIFEPPSQRLGACQLQPSAKPSFKLKPPVLSCSSVVSSSSTAGSTNPFKRFRPDDLAEQSCSSTKSELEPQSAVENKNISSSSVQSSERVTEDKDEEVDTADSIPEVGQVSSSSESQDDAKSSSVPTESQSTSVTSSCTSSVHNRGSTNQIVPLHGQAQSVSSDRGSCKMNGISTSNTGAGSSSVPWFIFGENLQRKIVGASDEADSSGSQTTNGESSSANLFSGATASGLSHEDEKTEEGGWSAGKSLVESSRELTEREASQKRKYDEVEVVTGEEGESNVLQIMCKLYGWGSGSWQERGRGILRLNDRKVNKEIYSRLVVRTLGTLTVIVNAKIWAEMSVEKVNEKSVRFTACDADGQPKIFLVMGAPKDIDVFYNSLEYRVAESRSHSNKEERKKPNAEDSSRNAT